MVFKATTPRAVIARSGKFRRVSAMVLVFLFAGTSALACEQPAFDYSIPDGKSASETEMSKAQQAVKSYVSAGEDYLTCMETDGGINSISLKKLRNSVIDDMEQVAAQFNRQLRYYRKRN